MTSKREQILSRLFVVLETVTGVEEWVRNRGELPTDKRPAGQLLDSDEVADRDAFGRGRPNGSPNFVVMSPEIYVTLKNVKPHNPNVGPELNEMLAKVQNAVGLDPTLTELVGENGEIRYDGAVTDLGEDRTLTGRIRIAISFRYVLRPNEL